MLFVKDLGPTAQMIAKQKLIGCSVDASSCWSPGSKHLFRQPECQIHKAFDNIQTRLPIPDTAESKTLIDRLHRVPTFSGNANYKVDTSYAGAGGKASARDQNQMLIHNNNNDTSLEVASSCNQRKIPVAYRGDAYSSNAMDAFGLLGCDILHQDRYSESQLDSNPSSVGARELNLSVAGSINSGKSSTPVMMVKSNCYRQAPQTTGSTMCNETKGSRPVPRSGGQDITAQDEVSGSVETGQEWKAPRAGSQFIFDLPYLRKRLDQINTFGSVKIFQQ